MQQVRGSAVVARRVDELERGDDTVDYGPVTHREGRKVWFEARVVTFPSGADELGVRLADPSRWRG